MAETTKRTVSKVRHEYRIDATATAKEIFEFSEAAQAEMAASGFDNGFHLETGDGEVIAYWDEDWLPGLTAAPQNTKENHG